MLVVSTRTVCQHNPGRHSVGTMPTREDERGRERTREDEREKAPPVSSLLAKCYLLADNAAAYPYTSRRVVVGMVVALILLLMFGAASSIMLSVLLFVLLTSTAVPPAASAIAAKSQPSRTLWNNAQMNSIIKRSPAAAS